MYCIDAGIPETSNGVSPALNGRSALQRLERSNMFEIRNRIMFNSTQHCHHKIRPIIYPRLC